MFVDSKTFMDLVAKVTRLEFENERLEKRIETLEKRPMVAYQEDDANERKTPDMHTIYDELVNGVVDNSLGRVKLTDGTD